MDGMTPEVPEVGERLRVAERERDSLARRLSVRYEELERSRAEVESLTDQLGDMRAMVSAAEADRYQGYRAGREDAAREALDHDAKLNGVRSRALVEYANQHHVVDERGWCSCDMYAPGDDDQCPERARLFAASLALVRDKPGP